MHPFPKFVIAAFCLLILANPASAHSIKKCDDIARNAVELATDYIDANVDDIADQFTHLSIDNRNEFKRKWPKFKIVCQDDGRNSGISRLCLSRPGLLGMAHGGPGNKVNICYYNLADNGTSTLCDLVGTIVHESGHANGYPIFANHNDPDGNVFNNDPVYVMGTRAENFCTNDTDFNNTTLLARFNLNNGEACHSDTQCNSGLCRGGECQCDQDSDCGTGERCFRPAAKKNYCSSITLGLGAECSRNGQCRSGKCQSDRCVCRTDGDCATGEVCNRRIGRPNLCETGNDGNRLLGAACTSNDQCKSTRCQGDACVCRSNTDCPAGQACYTPVTRANYCASTTSPLGAACSKNSQCRSDKCESGECVCRRDSDCGSNSKCKTPITKKNWCKAN